MCGGCEVRARIPPLPFPRPLTGQSLHLGARSFPATPGNLSLMSHPETKTYAVYIIFFKIEDMLANRGGRVFPDGSLDRSID